MARQNTLVFENEVEPIVDDWDKQAALNNHAKCKEYIQLMYRKSAEYGILAGVVGAPWPSKYHGQRQRPGGCDTFTS